MLSLRRGRVTAVVEQLPELVRLEVDGRPCVAYPRLTGPVEAGDDVLVNVQAVELGLGSGGFDVLHANLTRGLDLSPVAGAHVMTLPYTPLQAAVVHVEETDDLAASLDGMPVVCCTLHSQLAPVCAGLGPGLRVVYIQLPGGALPVSLSDTVRALKERGLLEVAVACGPCVDGDLQAVNVASALAWSAGQGFDATVCGVGPGIVGTGTRLGHGAVAASQAATAALALGGTPILAPRLSVMDTRERHSGVSHHTRAVLDLCPPGDVVVAWPAGLRAPTWLEITQQVDVAGLEDACAGLPLDHMGRGLAEDRRFFAAAFAAGRLAGALAA
ncbi:MAG: DUF3866 family protein [Gaiellaceae bacterium]